MNNGFLIVGKDDFIEGKARKAGFDVRISENRALEFDKTLIVEAGVKVPWDRLTAAMKILDSWDMAIPMWRYDELAQDVGTAKERKATERIIRDLRVPCFYHEMIFARKNERAQAFFSRWYDEAENGENLRLAFLRAYYQVKPILCVLPLTWTFGIEIGGKTRYKNRNPRIQKLQRKTLVSVEVSPGRVVKCNPGDEEKVLEHYRKTNIRSR